ncbi:MAG: HAMP domain-containing sensor histidine kinase [Agriterribacter sp.]
MKSHIISIRVDTEEDLLKIHALALKAGKLLSLSVAQQLKFAAAITDECIKHNSIQYTVVLYIENAVLKVSIKYSSTDIVIARQKINDPIDEATILAYNEPNEDIDTLSKEAYEDMRQFTFALAHDLKNSLAKLKLALSLLDEEEIPSQIQYYIETIQRSARKLETTMLNLGKIMEVGHTSPEVIKTISPELVFEELCEDFSENITAVNASIHKDFKIQEITYIEVYLKSLFNNMLSNALKYASPDRPLQFSIKAWKENNFIVFSFSDNGQGIDLCLYKSQLFKPFTRFSKCTEGSGIGLYLVKKMVEHNGGKVRVESVPGTGSTFFFYLKEYLLPV